MSIFAVSSSAYEAPRPKLATRQEAASDRPTFAGAMEEITHPDAPEAASGRPIPERPVQKVGVIDLGVAEAVSEPSAFGKLEGMAETAQPQAVALQMAVLAAAPVPGENADLGASGDQPQESLAPGASVASVAMTDTELAADRLLQIAAATAAAAGDNVEAGEAEAQEPEEGVAEGSGDATTGSDGQARSAALVGAVSPTDAQVHSKTGASDLSLPIASAVTKAATKPDAPTPAGQTVPAMAASTTDAPPKPDREVSEGEAAKTQQEAAKADSGLRADLQQSPSAHQAGKAPETVQAPAQQHQPSPLPEPGKPIPPAAVPVEIGLRALQGLKEFQIRLDPAELGRVEVRLEIGDDKSVTARVVVDRVETLHLLQRDAKTLERAFEQAGLKPSDGGVDISLRDQGQQSRGDGSDGRPNRYGDRSGSAGNDADNVPLQPVMQRRLHMGALDLSV